MLEAKDIFIPRHLDRQDHLKKEWLKRGYKREEIYIGHINPQTLFDLKDDIKKIKIVIGDVWIYGMGLDYLPFNLDEVTGYFHCFNNKLKSLLGCPKKVGGSFSCEANINLESLYGGPEYVGAGFNVKDCNLKSLWFSPNFVGGDFRIVGNPNLHSLEHMGNVRGRIIC